MRPYEVGTAAAIVLIAAVAMFDSRRDLFFDLSASGIGPGFYPFWSAALMGVAAAILTYRALATALPSAGVFAGPDSVPSVLKLVVPMFAYAASLPWLGLYVATALFMGFYASYLGRYRWYRVIAIGILVPLAIYAVFEIGFKLTLPKSIFYDLGFLF